MVDSDDKVTEATLETPADTQAPDNGDASAFMEILAKQGLDGPGAALEEGEAPKDDGKPELPETEKLDEAIASKEQFDTVDPKERERALTALRRAKTPQVVIDKLDDPALLKWGAELADAQAEADRRISAPKRAKKDAEPEQGDAAEPDKGTPAAPLEPLNLSELAKPLEEYLDGEGTEALGRMVGTGMDHVRKEVAQVEQVFGERMAALSGAVEQVLINSALRGLEGRFPEVSDPAKADAVRAKMLTLGKTGEYGLAQIDALASDAARLLGFDHRSSAAESGRTLELDRMRDTGQGSVTGRRLPREASSDDRDRAAFMEIHKKHQ